VNRRLEKIQPQIDPRLDTFNDGNLARRSGGLSSPTRDQIFSLRLSEELRKLIRDTAAGRGVTDSEYIRDLIISDKTGKRSRRGKRHVALYQKLDRLFAAIISFGNLVTSSQALCRCEQPECQTGRVYQEIISELKKATAAALHVESEALKK
jgi:hypothetical protein